MAFWEGRGELLYSCYHAWLLQCCTIRTLHENQEGGFCQNEQAPGKTAQREKLPPVIRTYNMRTKNTERILDHPQRRRPWYYSVLPIQSET